MAEGFVALLDVLGFSNMVAGENAPTKIYEYQKYLEETLADDHAEGVRYVAFSDTIVITTHGDRPEHFLNLVRRCSGLLGFMLQKEIPLRGAIARGFYARGALQNSESVFVAGRAILDAYNFEKKQNWLGIMLAPSAVEGDSRFTKALQPLSERLYRRHPEGLTEPDCVLRFCATLPLNSLP